MSKPHKLLFLGLFALLLLGSSFSLIFASSATISADVRAAANRLDSDDQGGDQGGNGGTPDLLNEDDAAFLRYAIAVGRSLGGDDSPRFVDDELTKRLLSEAERRNLNPEGRAIDAPWALSEILGGRQPAVLTSDERNVVVRSLEANIHEVSERIAIALADQAILKQIDAEAWLRVIHQDLLRLAHPVHVPDDPIGLVPPDQLDRAIASLQPHKRQLEDRVALFDTVDTRVRLAHIKTRLQQYQAARSSAGYEEFHRDAAGLKQLSREVSAGRWAEARMDAEARARAESARLLAQESALPPNESIIRYIHQHRGPPPDSPAACLTDAIRYHQLDIATALRSTSRVRAIAAEMEQVLDKNHPLRKLPEDTRLFSLLADSDLDQLSRLVRLVEADASTVVGADYGSFLSEWASAIKSESTRRSNGGTTHDWEKDPVTKRIVERHVPKGRVGDLSPEAQAKYLVAAQERYPSWNTMPTAVRSEVDRLVGTVIGKYHKLIRTAHADYAALTERLALVTGPIQASEGFAAYREGFRQLVREFRDYVWAAEERQISIPNEVNNHLGLLTGWFFGPDTPPPDPLSPPGTPHTPPRRGPGGNVVLGLQAPPGHEPPTPSGVASTEPINPKGGGPRPYLLTADPAIDNRALLVAELELKIKKLLASATVEPPKFATEMGRYTVSRDALSPVIRWSADSLDITQSRLPESEADWEGRLKLDEKHGKKVPFDFVRDVWEFKSFRPVGGGIHFGAVGRVSTHDLDAFTLRYNIKSKELVLVGPEARSGPPATVFRMAGVKPEVLKPLYQFANAGRNAAVSIGWGGERTDALKLNLGPQIVLLDPLLVDTPVGQDLILADTIGWEFHTKPLKKDRVSFHDKFEAALNASHKDAENALDAVIKDLKPYDPATRAEWIGAHRTQVMELLQEGFTRSKQNLASEMIAEDLVVLEAKTGEEAYSQLATLYARLGVRKELDEELGKLQLKKAASSDEPDLVNALARILRQQEREGRRSTAGSKVKIEAETMIRTALDASCKALQENPKFQSHFSTLKTAFERNVAARLTSLMRAGILSEKGCPSELLRLWLSASIADSPAAAQESTREICRLLLTNHPTLAVLMDPPDGTTVALGNGRIAVTGTLVYRYARTRITLQNDRVYFGRSPASDSEVESLDALNRLVNDNFAEIERDFPPMHRVVRYAELTALLKWAIQAKAAGKLGGIDLSDLAETPARDRSKFPTPDAILSR